MDGVLEDLGWSDRAVRAKVDEALASRVVLDRIPRNRNAEWHDAWRSGSLQLHGVTFERELYRTAEGDEHRFSEREQRSVVCIGDERVEAPQCDSANANGFDVCHRITACAAEFYANRLDAYISCLAEEI